MSLDNDTTELKDDPMQAAAEDAAAMMRVLANPARLRLLCALVPGPRTVGELEAVIGASQSYVSGQLARLRTQGFVACERDGRHQHYRLSDPRLTPVIERLYDVFCAPDN